MAKRKRRKKNIRPPLTLLDKSIYLLGILLSFSVAIALLLGLDAIRRLIAYQTEGTLAWESLANSLFSLPFILALEISAFCLIIGGWEGKQPIFGSKKIRYGEHPYERNCFPLFSKKRRLIKKNPSHQKFTQKLILLWLTVMILLACLIPLSLFSREVLYQDNHIERINMFNHVTEAYTADDFEHLTIRANYALYLRKPGSSGWKYSIELKMKDGTTFHFSQRNFDGAYQNSRDACLDKMLDLKSRLSPENITIEGADNVDAISEEYRLNEEQYAKLCKLFAE